MKLKLLITIISFSIFFGCSGRDLRLDVQLLSNPVLENGQIELSAKLKNNSSKIITIYHPETWGVSEIKLLDSAIQFKPASLEEKKENYGKIMVLHPGQVQSFQYSNLEPYVVDSAWRFKKKASLIPGEYEVQIRLKNPPPTLSKSNVLKDVWKGKIESNVVNLKVLINYDSTSNEQQKVFQEEELKKAVAKDNIDGMATY